LNPQIEFPVTPQVFGVNVPHKTSDKLTEKDLMQAAEGMYKKLYQAGSTVMTTENVNKAMDAGGKAFNKLTEMSNAYMPKVQKFWNENKPTEEQQQEMMKIAGKYAEKGAKVVGEAVANCSEKDKPMGWCEWMKGGCCKSKKREEQKKYSYLGLDKTD
jgi:hypothetical protein